MEIKHTETSIEKLLEFWVRAYELPDNTHLHSWEWFINPKTGRVMFKLAIADGPDPLGRTADAGLGR